ncbi:MAG: hypothetical protein IJ733_16005, partial [Lachnospiraceae bacterium]|nr:hypothetical protein [Lachnospiraceae bacterium]
MDKLYEFEKLPENVRQIGELGEKGRIYFEDYVVTYMERLFRKAAEKVIVIYLGKEGKGECAGNYFIYGAVELDFDILDAEQSFSAEKWDEIHDHMKTYFPESQILGWGIGIRMETHSIKKRIGDIHKKHFPKEHQICYVSDQSEETKALYAFDGLVLKKKQGYMVYYGKNPQMQDYMLRGKQRASLDANYADTVMTNVRAIIKKNEEKRQGRKTVTAAAAVFFVLLFVAGGFILLQSNRKLEKLEETLAVVSEPKIQAKDEESAEDQGKTENEKEGENDDSEKIEKETQQEKTEATGQKEESAEKPEKQEDEKAVKKPEGQEPAEEPGEQADEEPADEKPVKETKKNKGQAAEKKETEKNS